MPIRFRCSYCNRLLGIASRKAGLETTCPHCGYTITVPVPQVDDGRTERMNYEDFEAMLGKGATEVLPPPAVVAPPVPAPYVERPRDEQPKPPPPEKPRLAPPPIPSAPPVNPDEPPLFEGNMDDILGKTAVPAESNRDRPPKVSGMDAMSLTEPARQIVLSGQQATLLMVLAVVLLVLAFAAGYFMARG